MGDFFFYSSWDTYFNHGYTNMLRKTYLVEDPPHGGHSQSNSNGKSHDGSAAPELPRNESDYAPLVEALPQLPPVYPPTRLNIKDRPTMPRSPHDASALYNTPPKWPNTLPSYAKFPPQAVKPLKVFENPTPSKRPNTLPSRAKLPFQAVKN